MKIIRLSSIIVIRFILEISKPRFYALPIFLCELKKEIKRRKKNVNEG